MSEHTNYVQTSTEHVEVYSNSAKVRKKGSVHVLQGKNRFAVKGLSESADRDTVRVVIQGCPVRGTMSFLRQEKKEKTKEENKTDSKGIIEELMSQLDRNDNMRKLYLNSAAKCSQSMSGEDILNFLESVEKKLEEIDNKSRSLKQQVETLHRREYLQGQTENTKEETVIEMDCIIDKEGDYPVYLEYIDNAAGWRPYYEIASEGAESDVTIKLFANVTQQTAEDWKNVSVVLHTGSLTYAYRNPLELKTWEITLAAPGLPGEMMRYGRQEASVNPFAEDNRPTTLSFLAPEQDKETMVLNAAGKPESFPAEDMRWDSPLTGAENTSIERQYKVEETYTIYRGESGTRMLIDMFELKADYLYSTVPKNECAAYLTASVKNPPYDKLVPAKADLFFEGAYRGAMYIVPDRNKAAFEVSFGRIDSIDVERNVMKSEDTSTMLGNRKKRMYDISIRVKNNAGSNARIQVIDQLPVSRSGDVTIETKGLSGGEQNRETGAVRWDFMLAEGQEKMINMNFAVVFPKKSNLRGI